MTWASTQAKSYAGYKVVHFCIDDHARATDAEVLNEEAGETATAFASRAMSWFAGHGVAVQRIMGANGSPYKSRVVNELLGARKIRHILTRSYAPRMNGKAERLERAMLNEWAYLVGYPHSSNRMALLREWLHRYDRH